MDPNAVPNAVTSDFSLEEAQAFDSTSNGQLQSDASTKNAGSQIINSVGQLRKEDPKFYKQIIEQMAWVTCDAMQEAQEQIHEMNEEAEY